MVMMCEALSVFIIITWAFLSLYLMGQLKNVTGKGEKECVWRGDMQQRARGWNRTRVAAHGSNVYVHEAHY